MVGPIPPQDRAPDLEPAPPARRLTFTENMTVGFNLTSLVAMAGGLVWMTMLYSRVKDLPEEFKEHKKRTWQFHISNKNSHYNSCVAIRKLFRYRGVDASCTRDGELRVQGIPRRTVEKRSRSGQQEGKEEKKPKQ